MADHIFQDQLAAASQQHIGGGQEEKALTTGDKLHIATALAMALIRRRRQQQSQGHQHQHQAPPASAACRFPTMTVAGSLHRGGCLTAVTCHPLPPYINTVSLLIHPTIQVRLAISHQAIIHYQF